MATYQIRVEKDHKELQRLTFEGFGSAYKRHSFSNTSNRGLTNVDDVLYVDGYGEFCGDTGGAIVFFWSGGVLYNVRTLSDSFDAPYFASETFLYPSDMEGRKGLIVLHELEGHYPDEEDEGGNTAVPAVENEAVYTLDKKTTFRWDGKQLVKAK